MSGVVDFKVVNEQACCFGGLSIMTFEQAPLMQEVRSIPEAAMWSIP